VAGTLRLAVAQTVVPEDPTDLGALRESGAQIRSLMREASAARARLVQFPEGAITYPSKRVMSVQGPDRVAASDWSRPGARTADLDRVRVAAPAHPAEPPA
jgi:predicted amidohydrolase